MAEQAERAFAKTFLTTISTQPIVYADDYQQPSQHSLKRVPVLPIPVPPPPARKPHHEANQSSASISLVFKSLKPTAAFTLSVHPTDTISAIKAQLAALPSAPPAEAQRLLVKGKALLDTKLLKEYSIKDGDTLNIAIKPGFNWDPTARPEPLANDTPMSTDSTSQPPGFGSGSLDPKALPQHKGRHGRIPSVVLSPSPSYDNLRSRSPVEKDILITLDDPLPSPQSETLTTYHQTVSKPEFWQRLLEFLKKEFTAETDANLAFESFLCATKGSVTASEIAKIRDTVGVIGMAGI